jgi:hypothetical protein
VGRLPGVNPETDRPAFQIAHHPELCANRGDSKGDTLPKLQRVASLRIGSDWLPGLGSTRRVAIPAERGGRLRANVNAIHQQPSVGGPATRDSGN